MATVTKTISDAVGTSDSVGKTVTKTRSDVGAPTDAGRSKQPNKVVSDSVGLASTRRVFPTPVRPYDNLATTDTYGAELAIELIVTPIDGAALVSIEVKLSQYMDFTRFALERVNASKGTVTPVRGGEIQNLLGELDFLLYDAECPLSTPDNIGDTIYYVATAYVTDGDGLVDQDDSVSVSSDSFNLHDSPKAAWIKIPGANGGINSVNNKFLMDHMDNWSYPVRVLTQSPVLGRRTPIIVTDVMGSRTGTMYIASYPEAETVYGMAWQRPDILALISQGYILFFQTTGDTGVDDFFFMVTGDVQETQLGTGTPITPDRVWAIPFTEVESPETDTLFGGVGAHTWLEIATNYDTWQAVVDNHATWQDVLDRG